MKFYSFTETSKKNKGDKSGHTYLYEITSVKAKDKNEAEQKIDDMMFSLNAVEITAYCAYRGIYTKKELKLVIKALKKLLKKHGSDENKVYGHKRILDPTKSDKIWKMLDRSIYDFDFYDAEDVWDAYSREEAEQIVKSYKKLKKQWEEK